MSQTVIFYSFKKQSFPGVRTWRRCVVWRPLRYCSWWTIWNLSSRGWTTVSWRVRLHWARLTPVLASPATLFVSPTGVESWEVDLERHRERHRQPLLFHPYPILPCQTSPRNPKPFPREILVQKCNTKLTFIPQYFQCASTVLWLVSEDDSVSSKPIFFSEKILEFRD